MTAENIQELVEKCIAPVPGANPCGEPARYEPDYEEARTEMQKLTAMSSAQDAIDWKKIIDCSSRILSEKSKDLTISGYLCISLFQAEGYEGLAGGLKVFHGLLEQYWDGLFPPLKKLKSRAMAVQWLDTRIGDIVSRREPASGEAEAVGEASESIAKMRELIPQKFGEDAPSLYTLAEALKDHVQVAGPARAPAEGTPAAPAGPKVVVPDTPAEALDTVRKMVPVLREADATSGVPYRLLRCVKWDPLEEEPPTPDGDGKTRVPAPRPAVRQALDSLLEAGNWEGLLGGCEKAFQDISGTFWLDLQRLLCIALQSLGPDYERASRAVVSETAFLLDRLPNLANLTFADSTPFADDLTKMWIEEEVRGAAEQAPSAEVVRMQSKPVEGMDEELREAQKKVSKKDFEGAMGLLQKGIDADPTRRGKFIRKLAAGKLCLSSGQHAWALSVLEGLDQDLDQMSLAQWEPEMCAEVWEALYFCYKKLLSSKKVELADSLAERAALIRNKLFRLDLRSAVSADLRKK